MPRVIVGNEQWLSLARHNVGSDAVQRQVQATEPTDEWWQCFLLKQVHMFTLCRYRQMIVSQKLAERYLVLTSSRKQHRNHAFNLTMQ